MKERPPPPAGEKTPLERMADLTRRIVAVPKQELAKRKRPKRRRNGPAA